MSHEPVCQSQECLTIEWLLECSVDASLGELPRVGALGHAVKQNYRNVADVGMGPKVRGGTEAVESREVDRDEREVG